MILMPLTPLAVKEALTSSAGGAIGPGFGMLAAISAAAADVVSSQPESSVLTIIASILGATGVIGWGFRTWVTAQLARSEEQRKAAAKERAEEREEDRHERERQRQEAAVLLQRNFDDRAAREAYLLEQIEMWQRRTDTERERADQMVRLFMRANPDDAL